MTIAAVIPAYNERFTIRQVIEQTLPLVDKVIVIDDGSTDDTLAQIRDLPIHLIHHTHNQGKATSLLDGFRYARQQQAQAIITIDADAQHDPRDIPQLIAKAQSGAQSGSNQLVIGARVFNREAAPWLRRCANKVADFFISWACGQPIVDSQSGFRYYPAQAVDMLLAKPHSFATGFVFESEILIDCCQRQCQLAFVPIASCYPDDRRASHYHPWHDTLKIARMISRRLWHSRMNLTGLINALRNPRPLRYF